MTFEEFFKKKRIDLAALQAGEPVLFSEFKTHYELMGEKSFDHTKKYWFNKLRLLYHLAPELKPEKMHLENQLAEQTIVETLIDTIPVPSVGFKPRFKAGMGSKPAPNTSDTPSPAPEHSATETPEVNTAAANKDQSPAFQQEKEAMQNMADNTPRTTEEAEAKAESETAKKPGFKPRFNMKMAAVKPAADEENKEQPQTLADLPTPLPTTEDANEKPAYKPRFSMKTVTAKSAEADEPKTEAEPIQNNTEITPPIDAAATKPGFKPRFNMKMVASKPAETNTADEKESVEQAAVKAPEPEKPEVAPPVENAEAKPAYKPRFNMKNIKPTPPEE